MVDAEAVAIMPLGSPIGSNRGIQTKELVRILIEEISLPIIVDAGIGRPSETAEAMEMGAAAVLVNTAIANRGRSFKNGTCIWLCCSSRQRRILQGLAVCKRMPKHLRL